MCIYRTHSPHAISMSVSRRSVMFMHACVSPCHFRSVVVFMLICQNPQHRFPSRVHSVVVCMLVCQNPQHHYSGTVLLKSSSQYRRRAGSHIWILALYVLCFRPGSGDTIFDFASAAQFLGHASKAEVFRVTHTPHISFESSAPAIVIT